MCNRPVWEGGLRRVTVRDMMRAYIETHPVDAEMLASGFAPTSMVRVKQPFDYERLRACGAESLANGENDGNPTPANPHPSHVARGPAPGQGTQ